jgi:hypothetical protein
VEPKYSHGTSTPGMWSRTRRKSERCSPSLGGAPSSETRSVSSSSSSSSSSEASIPPVLARVLERAFESFRVSDLNTDGWCGMLFRFQAQSAAAFAWSPRLAP